MKIKTMINPNCIVREINFGTMYHTELYKIAGVRYEIDFTNELQRIIFSGTLFNNPWEYEDGSEEQETLCDRLEKAIYRELVAIRDDCDVREKGIYYDDLKKMRHTVFMHMLLDFAKSPSETYLDKSDPYWGRKGIGIRLDLDLNGRTDGDMYDQGFVEVI
jgi:hypothetical protein